MHPIQSSPRLLWAASIVAIALSACGGGQEEISLKQKAYSNEQRGRPVDPPPPEVPLASQLATFANGYEGWESNGVPVVDPSFGNKAPSLALRNTQWHAEFSTQSVPWLDTLRTGRRIELALDVHAKDVIFLGAQTEQQLRVEIRDYGQPNEGYPYTSVSAPIGVLKRQPIPHRWSTFTLQIDDTHSAVLPTGWTGFGAEDAAGNPILPAGRTFADVIANADELVFTTMRPGYVSGFITWNVSVDNLAVKAFPLRSGALVANL